MLKEKIGINKEFLLIIFLLLIGIFIRFYLLGSIPPGLNQDEASTGYDAYSTLKYGIDRNGYHNPIQFISFGCGQYALSTYLTIPFISIFGLSPFSVRLTNAFFGFLSLLFFFLLIREISNKKVALISLFLLIISPWHIMMSRWGLDGNLFPSIFMIASYFLIKGFERPYFFPISYFLYALCLYSYGTAYFFIPIFIIAVSIYILKHKKVSLLNFLICSVIFILTALPIGIFFYINHYKLNPIKLSWISIPILTGTPRYNAVSSLFSVQFFQNSLLNFYNFIKMFLITQFDGLIWNSIPLFGHIYIISIPFLLFGVYKFFKDNLKFKSFNKNFIIIFWFIISILMAIVTKININRINIIFPPAIFLTGFGIYKLTKGKKRLLKSIVILYFLIFILFSLYYFLFYPKQVGLVFNESFDEAIEYSAEFKDKEIVITDNMIMPYIHVLFHLKIDPKLYNNSVIYSNPGASVQKVKSFDRFKFGIDIRSISLDKIYIFLNSESYLFKGKDFNFKEFKYFSVAIPQSEKL